MIKTIFIKIKNLPSRTKKNILFAFLFIFIIISGSKFLQARAKKPAVKQPSVSAPQKSQSINKDFTFPVGKNAEGTPINMVFTIQTVSINNQIVWQGQTATAVPGRTFLIVDLKIANSFNQGISINTKDYVRLARNGNENEWLAPDLNNDPVEVQAISTKYTRLGFPINLTDKNLVLQIGEIKGDKEKITLNLK